MYEEACLMRKEGIKTNFFGHLESEKPSKSAKNLDAPTPHKTTLIKEIKDSHIFAHMEPHCFARMEPLKTGFMPMKFSSNPCSFQPRQTMPLDQNKTDGLSLIEECPPKFPNWAPTRDLIIPRLRRLKSMSTLYYQERKKTQTKFTTNLSVSGKSLNQYQMMNKIGQGSTSNVYRATDG